MNASHPDQDCVLIDSVLETLRQGEALLAGISDSIYTQRVSAAYHASIGGHYRHCLDHFRSLLHSAREGDLNYDRRERGTRIEADRSAALQATRELMEGYRQLNAECLSRPVGVTCKTSYASAASQAAPSTVGREVMYAVAHAVHHYALIGVMAGLLGSELPHGFGIAPSTLHHQNHSTSNHASSLAPSQSS